MSLLLVFLTLILASCAHQVERHLASSNDPVQLGMIDLKETVIRHFPPENSEHEDEHMFHLTLVDWNKKLVDLDASEFTVMSKGKTISHTMERLAVGRYTLNFHADGLADTVLKLQGKKLKLLIDKEKQLPSQAQSNLEIVSNENHQLVLKLTLKDKKGQMVGLLELPEIISSEEVMIKGIQMLQSGVWEVTIHYPEVNFVLYLSVRANGVYLNNLFRFQHIEK